MPILTPPSAAAGCASKKAPIASVGQNTDFMASLPAVFCCRYYYFITPPLPIYLKLAFRPEAFWLRRFGSTGGDPVRHDVWLFLRGRTVGEVAHHDVEDRREDQPEQGDAEHAEEHGDTNR